MSSSPWSSHLICIQKNMHSKFEGPEDKKNSRQIALCKVIVSVSDLQCQAQQPSRYVGECRGDNRSLAIYISPSCRLLARRSGTRFARVTSGSSTLPVHSFDTEDQEDFCYPLPNLSHTSLETNKSPKTTRCTRHRQHVRIQWLSEMDTVRLRP